MPGPGKGARAVWENVPGKVGGAGGKGWGNDTEQGKLLISTGLGEPASQEPSPPPKLPEAQ